MAYTPTKTHYGIAITILVLVILYFGFRPDGWFRSSTPSAPKDGDACTTSGGTAGTYKGGICTDSGGAPGGGPGNMAERTTFAPTNPLNALK